MQNTGSICSHDHGQGTWPGIPDAKTLVDISGNLTGKTLRFYFTAKRGMGYHCLLVAARRTGANTYRKQRSGLVANHFDSASIIKNYNYLFGDRSG